MKKDSRFIKLLSEGGLAVANEIWVDRETGVNYLFHAAGYAGGLCALLGPDGKPVVTDRYTLEHEHFE